MDKKDSSKKWENGNYVMRKYGVSIRQGIENVFLPTLKIINAKRIADIKERYMLHQIPPDQCGKA